jgi:menaquinone-specific isochorismate synthase
VDSGLVARTREIPDPGDLLARLPDPAPLIWLHHGDGLVGWGEAARVAVPPGDDRDAAAHDLLAATVAGARVDDPLRLPGTGLVAFGALTFDRRAAGSVLVVPRVVLGRRDGRAWLTTITGPGDPDPGDPLTEGPTAPLRPTTVAGWRDGTLPPEEWGRRVARAVRAMRGGAYDKVVLARDLYARTTEPIDARVVAGRLAERYPDCYTYACDGLIGATPELLIRRFGRRLSSLVLAGSAPRGADTAEDDALGAELMSSAKNVEEHGYAAESARASLAPLCASITCDDTPFLLKVANIQHLATRIAGELADDLSSLDVAAALHPTAAVGGTPTDVAVQAIRDLEGMDRGRYAGPVGWVDGRGNGEWGIALRGAQLVDGPDGPGARLFAGAGIVAGSDPATELAEVDMKFRVVRNALD